MFSMQIGIGMPMGGNILQRSMGMATGINMGIMSGPQGTMAYAGLFGQDQVGFSPDAMMGQGPSCFNHPLMNNGFGMPMCGFNNGMGMIPGMNPGMNQMGGQNQMMMMMMQLMMMMMQMMQQQGMGGMQNGMGMPNFGNPLNMGMPGCGGCGGGRPHYGNPINMAPPYGHSRPLPPFAAGNPNTGPRVSSPPAVIPGAPPNGHARFNNIQDRRGNSDMATGTMTINGHNYQFRSGGHGRGYLPEGDYTVTNGRQRTSSGMYVGTSNGGRYGYSFDLSDKYDSRVGGTRSLLRIHPDGGSEGTMGCIGVVGDEDVQRRFYQDMQAEIARNGGSYTLRVGS